MQRHQVGRKVDIKLLALNIQMANKHRNRLFNIAHYQRNANQNYNEISPHTNQSGHHKKYLQTINAGEDVKEKEPSYTVGGNGKQYGDSLENQE